MGVTRARSSPTLAYKRLSVEGPHWALGMRVMFEFLIPGVEQAKEADFGAEMLGIASDFEECLSA